MINSPESSSPDNEPQYYPYNQDPGFLEVIARSPDAAEPLRIRIRAWEMAQQILDLKPESPVHQHLLNLATLDLDEYIEGAGLYRSKIPPSENPE